MVKFVHFADSHLGAFRDKRLRELNFQAFEKTIDYCLKEKVDFVLVAGDLFDIAVPELEVVKKTAGKFLLLKNAGIPVYVVYGSHDYSPNHSSIIDVFEASGLLSKVSQGGYEENGKKRLECVTDEKTGVNLVGISGRAKSLDSAFFNDLDLSFLESLPKPKVFVFHNTLEETKPGFLAAVEGVPLSVFPKGFDYYAAGHVHEKACLVKEPFGLISFPGPLFAADYRDLESLASTKSGFFVVELNEGGAKADFVELDVARVSLLEFNATGKNSEQVSRELIAQATSFSDSLVLLKVFGELEGNVSEIDFKRIRDLIEEHNCIFYLNRNALKSKSLEEVRVAFSSKKEVEDKVFSEGLSQFKFSKELIGDSGLVLAKNMFNELKAPLLDGESKKDYESRVVSKSLKWFN
ncbi:MAG: exonuclease SbcCD subunit D [Candidatus Micrarchaeota archaeon]